MAPHEIDVSNFFFLRSHTNPSRIHSRNETNELMGPIFVPRILYFASHVKRIKDAGTEIRTANLLSLYSCIEPQDHGVLLVNFIIIIGQFLRMVKSSSVSHVLKLSMNEWMNRLFSLAVTIMIENILGQ